MSDQEEKRVYLQFQTDLLQSKFKGTHTEAQMVERLVLLCENKNKYALRGLATAKLVCSPDSRMGNSIWEKGAIYRMEGIAADPLKFPE